MNNNTLLFAGDSITDADHLWEPGPDGLGHGYVHMVSEMLKTGKTGNAGSAGNVGDFAYRIINSGYNGYRAEDLLRRWNRICLGKQPDLVTLLVGVNEAGAAMEGMVTEPEVFERTYERLITEVLHNTRADMILMEPFLFRYPAYLITWRKYFDPLLPVIARLADKYSLPFIRLDGPLNELADRLGVDQVTVDGIHLTETGNRFLAEQWIQVYRQVEK
ncbi:MAG: GDSL-type esterase/lipase family protein [Lachnospiraceae bacterium]|nr:GDSL-type esterase/lipase family protein [Lachnospiraceae bacterium]